MSVLQQEQLLYCPTKCFTLHSPQNQGHSSNRWALNSHVSAVSIATLTVRGRKGKNTKKTMNSGPKPLGAEFATKVLSRSWATASTPPPCPRAWKSQGLGCGDGGGGDSGGGEHGDYDDGKPFCILEL